MLKGTDKILNMLNPLSGSVESQLHFESDLSAISATCSARAGFVITKESKLKTDYSKTKRKRLERLLIEQYSSTLSIQQILLNLDNNVLQALFGE